MPIDRHSLRLPFSEEPVRDGFCAQFHADGQLARLVWYRSGREVRELQLDPETGRGISRVFEHFGASDDLSDSTDEQLTEWAAVKLQEISEAEEGILRCSFCLRLSTEVARLIEGAGTYICNECVRLCNEVIATGPEGAG